MILCSVTAFNVVYLNENVIDSRRRSSFDCRVFKMNACIQREKIVSWRKPIVVRILAKTPVN